MGVIARAALAAGAEVLGIIPQRLLDREVGKRDLTELRVTATMFERKALLIDGSGRLRALPGGLGTLDEILDAVTLRQLGYHAKPILLVDTGGYWQPCQAAVRPVRRRAGFADPAARYRLLRARAGRGRGWCGRLQAAAPAGPAVTGSGLRGLRCACCILPPEQRHEVDGIDHQRREAAVARGVGHHPPREREQQPRALDQQQRLQAVLRDVGQREQAAIGAARPGRPGSRRPWRRRSARARPRTGPRRAGAARTSTWIWISGRGWPWLQARAVRAGSRTTGP